MSREGAPISAAPLALDPSVLDRLMPMHLALDAAGRVTSAGPTLAKILDAAPGAAPLIGAGFLDLFEIRKPGAVKSMDGLLALSGQRLNLALRHAPHTGLRGLALSVGPGQGMIVNLSFGIGVADAVRDLHLTNADFAPTDLTVELLYLTEVKAAVMQELAALNQRLRAAQQCAERRARTDPLTGLANRRTLDSELSRLVDGLARGGPGFALLHLDLDRFKAVNDTYGHAAGDAVLAAVADALRRAVRKHDTLARVGGDEFVILLAGVTDPAAVLATGERIIRDIECPVPHGHQSYRISASIGAVLSTRYAAPDAALMMRDADALLYRSKAAGRGRCTLQD